MSTSSANMLQFSPLQSFVNSTFWHKFAEIKLDFDRLSEAPKEVNAFYTNYVAKSCNLELDYSAFNSFFLPPKFCYAAHGLLYNKNTIEDFKACDKQALITQEGQKLLDDFKGSRILDDPSLLARFLILSFADIKCHTYYYWFAFPCPLSTTLSLVETAQKLQDIPAIQHFHEICKSIPEKQQNFFILKASDTTNYFTLKQVLNEEEFNESTQLTDYYFCFADASEYDHPSWLMRVYATFILHKCRFLIGKQLNFLGLRYDKNMQACNSLIWQVVQKKPLDFDNESPETPLQFVGWEANRSNKMGPRIACMKDSMDSAILAENSAKLNLKLMKWRLLPALNLDIIAETKCLLFGAGTLGCAVARNLLAWGFKQITLIDNGKVGFSNPVRQSLYRHSDAEASNAMKAEIAAARLKEINPNLLSFGYALEIPMPGHTVGASMVEQTLQNINTITALVKEHDAIFLLTDSRESRWLPTLLGAAFDKIVINAALGFDSYLVMRHGGTRQSDAADTTSSESQKIDIGDLKCIKGNNLGCYFCNDITAPGNSMKDRTLDQQCTVTRPGVSNIASSYAVELLVSLLQHPQRELAPAYYSSTGKSEAKIPEGLLGIIPHSIRGLLCNFENILPATQKFTQCIACSKNILKTYREQGNDFLFKVFETAKYLEDITGISKYGDLSNDIIDYDSDLSD